MKKFFKFFLIIYVLGFTNFISAATIATGFIPGQIWYSKDSLVEGDTVKIYTAVWNNTASSMSAKVEFYDKNVILGFKDIVIPPSSLKETSVSWKVTSGDHSISAKIISPSITLGGKKESISLENSSTETDRQFIPVVVKTVDGQTATSSDVIKSQIDKATSSLDDIIPSSVSDPVSSNVGALDDFRSNTFDKIKESKIETQKKIDEFKKMELGDNLPDKNAKDSEKKTLVENSKMGIEEATERPITYLKLIFLSILSIIFGSSIFFYLLLIFLVFLIARFIYRKIRNR